MRLTQQDLESYLLVAATILRGLDRAAAKENLAAFIRSLVGLDRAAAKEKFAAFLDGRTYTADQIRFVNYIIDHLTQNGTLNPGLLYDHPFTDIHYAGPDGIFTENQTDELMAIVAGVNESIAI